LLFKKFGCWKGSTALYFSLLLDNYMANLVPRNGDCFLVEIYWKKQTTSSATKKAKTPTTMTKIVTKMSAKKVAVTKRGVWQHISHDEYYWVIVGLCLDGTISREILRKHIVTKQEIVDTWGLQCTGPSGNGHGGFSINAPTAKHLRSWVKELWGQIFLKK
jgi:hypothetical protein